MDEYRQDSGELIDESSWLMRDLWDTGAGKEGNGFDNKAKEIGIVGNKAID